MKTVTLDVRPLSDSLADFTPTWRSGKGEASARISFATPELLWKVLTARRWDLRKAMAGRDRSTCVKPRAVYIAT